MTNKEIREKVLEVLKRHYNDYPNYTEYDAMNNNPTPDEVFVDQIMQIVEEEKVEVIKAVINEINRDKYWLTGEFDLDGFLERLNDLSSLKKSMKKIPYTKFNMEPLKVRAKSSILSNLAPQNQPELKLKKGTRSFEETLRLVEEVEEQTKGEYFVKHNCNCPKEKDCRAILELHTPSKTKGECWCGSNHHIDDLLDTSSTSSISNKSEEITEDVTKDEEITPSKPVEELPGEVQYIKHCRTCICK